MVKIGTPLTKVAKKALLCGSGELGKEVAIELQRRPCHAGGSSQLCSVNA